MLVTIDPGLHATGIALWGPQGNLLRAELARVGGKQRGSRAFAEMAREVYRLVDAMCRVASGGVNGADDTCLDVLIEDQQVNFHRTPNPNDLLQVTGVAGAVAGFFAARDQESVDCIASVLPEKWKGSIKKEDMTERIRRRLIERNELWRVDSKVPASLVHNVLDACGIGLWKLGILEPRRAIHRE